MTSGRWTPTRGPRRASPMYIKLRGWALALLAASLPSLAVADGVNVVVTIKPIHSIVSQVMAGVGTPTLLVEGSASPHSFSLKPSHVRAIDAADVFIRVSERLEPFTGKIVRSLPDGVRLVTLIDAPGLKLLDQRQSGMFEPHQHGDADRAAEDAAPDTSHPATRDSHIWLDPENAKAIGRYIARVLGERYPAHAAQFTANAERLDVEINALAAELTAATLPLRGKPFIVFHDAYQYFDARFDLDAVGSITVSPDVQPSAMRLTALRRKIRSLKAVCVFAEPLFQPQLVAALTEGTDARPGTLDPEGLSLQPGPQLYFTLMHNLAAGLRACLAPAT
jgi:zinc transport system substrate-binding protein